jgi:hypothetical protein
MNLYLNIRLPAELGGEDLFLFYFYNFSPQAVVF